MGFLKLFMGYCKFFRGFSRLFNRILWYTFFFSGFLGFLNRSFGKYLWMFFLVVLPEERVKRRKLSPTYFW